VLFTKRTVSFNGFRHFHDVSPAIPDNIPRDRPARNSNKIQRIRCRK
jgi:hypothetical protein